MNECRHLKGTRFKEVVLRCFRFSMMGMLDGSIPNNTAKKCSWGLNKLLMSSSSKMSVTKRPLSSLTMSMNSLSAVVCLTSHCIVLVNANYSMRQVMSLERIISCAWNICFRYREGPVNYGFTVLKSGSKLELAISEPTDPAWHLELQGVVDSIMYMLGSDIWSRADQDG